MRLKLAALALLAVACNETRLPETDHRIGTERAPLAKLENGVVVSKPGDAPGESDLWLHPAKGEPRALTSAPGGDDMPAALSDGRIAFVSNRTTVASLWILDPATGEERQLTNVGLAAGKNMAGFVPTPMKELQVDGKALRYEAAPGQWWSVDADSGKAERVEVTP
jgi:Tol biopolymer transport system component